MNPLTLSDGRYCFYQWDTGRHLIVHDHNCTEVHFCNGSYDCSLVCEVKEHDGLRVVDVPDILLQESKSITAFAFVEANGGGYTRFAIVFPVRARRKPEDYVYTETERKNWEALDRRMAELEDDMEQQVAASVEKYLKDNPIDTGVQFKTDATLKLEDGILSVNTTNDMEQDNTLPITSAGVFATVGNIEALLKTI